MGLPSSYRPRRVPKNFSSQLCIRTSSGKRTISIRHSTLISISSLDHAPMSLKHVLTSCLSQLESLKRVFVPMTFRVRAPLRLGSRLLPQASPQVPRCSVATTHFHHSHLTTAITPVPARHSINCPMCLHRSDRTLALVMYCLLCRTLSKWLPSFLRRESKPFRAPQATGVNNAPETVAAGCSWSKNTLINQPLLPS